MFKTINIDPTTYADISICPRLLARQHQQPKQHKWHGKVQKTLDRWPACMEDQGLYSLYIQVILNVMYVGINNNVICTIPRKIVWYKSTVGMVPNVSQ